MLSDPYIALCIAIPLALAVVALCAKMDWDSENEFWELMRLQRQFRLKQSLELLTLPNERLPCDVWDKLSDAVHAVVEDMDLATIVASRFREEDGPPCQCAHCLEKDRQFKANKAAGLIRVVE